MYLVPFLPIIIFDILFINIHCESLNIFIIYGILFVNVSIALIQLSYYFDRKMHKYSNTNYALTIVSMTFFIMKCLLLSFLTNLYLTKVISNGRDIIVYLLIIEIIEVTLLYLTYSVLKKIRKGEN